jgi:hypothetical protein
MNTHQIASVLTLVALSASATSTINSSNRYAYGANMGWTDWRADDTNGAVIGQYVCSGYIYAANIGWISLSNSVAFVQTDHLACPDSDGDGIADGYERRWAPDLDTINGTTDQDRDGVSDRDESVADTSPTDPEDFLRITRISSSAAVLGWDLTWTSQPTRWYQLQLRDDLDPGSLWLNSGLGLIPASSGATTTRLVPDPDPAPPHRFFRVEAIQPLAP